MLLPTLPVLSALVRLMLMGLPESSHLPQRMMIAIPDIEALDLAWGQFQKSRIQFERIVVNTMRELTKLNPQNHVHVSEFYATVNVVRRLPPGPILALLASRAWFVHVGDLHYRFDNSEEKEN